MMDGPKGYPPTSAHVDFVTSTNQSFTDAIQFDPPGPTGTTGYWPGSDGPWFPIGTTGPNWTLTGMNFRLDIKGNVEQAAPLLSINSQPVNSTLIVTDDAINRVIHFNVPEAVLTGATGATGATGIGLLPGRYVYDFIMYDGSSPPVRTQLMHGEFKVTDGITGG